MGIVNHNSTLNKKPLEFQHIQFQRLRSDGGHYMIFYSISNNKSLTADEEFNDKIGVSIDSEDIYGEMDE